MPRCPQGTDSHVGLVVLSEQLSIFNHRKKDKFKRLESSSSSSVILDMGCNEVNFTKSNNYIKILHNIPEIGMWDLFFGLVSESSTSHIGSAKIVTYRCMSKTKNCPIFMVVFEGRGKMVNWSVHLMNLSCKSTNVSSLHCLSCWYMNTS